MTRKSVSLVVFSTLWLSVCLVAGPAFGADDEMGLTPKPGKPVYNPHTKSWFELRVDMPTPSNWQNAVKFARRHTFKGVRGRLAVVKDLKHTVSCGQILTRLARPGSDYAISALSGNLFGLMAQNSLEPPSKCGQRNGIGLTCAVENRGIQFMPVYYLPTRYGFKWQASGPAKYFVSYFVEYPTGAENPEDASKP